MGKFEQEDSKKVLAGQHCMRGTSRPRSLWEFLFELCAQPYRAYKNKKHQEDLRRRIIGTTIIDEKENNNG